MRGQELNTTTLPVSHRLLCEGVWGSELEAAQRLNKENENRSVSVVLYGGATAICAYITCEQLLPCIQGKKNTICNIAGYNKEQSEYQILTSLGHKALLFLHYSNILS